MKTKKLHGFTLIELLVVLAIIGIVMAISLFGIQGTRESSRDAKRKADLQLIVSGLELYKSDCNKYPPSLPAAGSPLTGDGLTPSGGTSNTCLTSNVYISSMPSDPVTGRNYVYSYVPPGSFQCTYYQLPQPCFPVTQTWPTLSECGSGCRNQSNCFQPTSSCNQITGGTYELCTALEGVSGSTVTCGSSSSCGSAACNYKATNP